MPERKHTAPDPPKRRKSKPRRLPLHDPERRHLSVRDLEQQGISRRQQIRLRNLGLLAYYRFRDGGKVYYRKEDVDRLVESRVVATASDELNGESR